MIVNLANLVVVKKKRLGLGCVWSVGCAWFVGCVWFTK